MHDPIPCPFCGSDEIHQAWDLDERTWAYCEACKAQGPKKMEWNDAVAAWDARAGLKSELEGFRHVLIGLLDDLRSDRPFDSGPFQNDGPNEFVNRDEYNAETRGYRMALTDLECAINSAAGVHD